MPSPLSAPNTLPSSDTPSTSSMSIPTASLPPKDGRKGTEVVSTNPTRKRGASELNSTARTTASGYSRTDEIDALHLTLGAIDYLSPEDIQDELRTRGYKIIKGSKGTAAQYLTTMLTEELNSLLASSPIMPVPALTSSLFPSTLSIMTSLSSPIISSSLSSSSTSAPGSLPNFTPPLILSSSSTQTSSGNALSSLLVAPTSSHASSNSISRPPK